MKYCTFDLLSGIFQLYIKKKNVQTGSIKTNAFLVIGSTIFLSGENFKSSRSTLNQITLGVFVYNRVFSHDGGDH